MQPEVSNASQLAKDAAPAANLDANARVEHDISCRSCGYNLRGLFISARCPECSAAVVQSIRGDMLLYSDPRWLERLSLGALLIAITGLGGFFVTVVNGITISILSASVAISPGLIKAMAAGLSFALAAVHWSGFWLLTSPDPAADHDESVWAARSVARYGTLAILLVAPLQQMSDFKTAFNMNTTASVSLEMRLLGMALVLATIAQLVGQTAMFVTMRRLARRMPDHKLANQTNTVMWGFLISQILGTLALASVYLLAPRTGATGPISAIFFVIALMFMCVTKPIGFIFDIWAIVLLFLYRGRFKWLAHRARSIWTPPL
jgi:hypothetical protein